MVFVDSCSKLTDPADNSQSGMDISTLSNILFRVALALPPAPAAVLGDQDEEGNTTTAANATETNDNEVNNTEGIVAAKFIFSHHDHDSTMIETTLRRNASCEGFWNVERDSLLVALPPRLAESGNKDISGASQKPDTTASEYDDEIWMGKLATTVKMTDSNVANITTATYVSGVTTSVPSTTKGRATSRDVTATTEKKKVATTTDPASFFENLLKNS